MIKTTGSGATDIGRKRHHNEDAFRVNESLGLYLVCDGLGGHAAGEIASETACASVERVLKQNHKTLQQYAEDPSFFNRAKAVAVIEMAIDTASRDVHALATHDPEKQGMATTLVTLVVMGSHAIVAHVGDSRVYLFRKGKTYQLTEDHTMINEQVKEGEITADEAARSRKTGIVTRTVGFFEAATADTLHIELVPGDRFLLCSDGLSDYFAGGEFAGACQSVDEDQVVPSLIQLANDRGGKDNITAVLVSVQGELSPEATEADRKIEVLKRIPIFSHLGYQDLMKILSTSRVRTYEAGRPIIEEGETGDEMYICLTGKVEVTKMGQPLTELGAGSFFGEMALIDQAPRSASVTATEPTRLMVIKRVNFFRLIRGEHELATKLLWAFCQVIGHRLRQTTEDLSVARSEIETGSEPIEDLADLIAREEDPDEA